MVNLTKLDSQQVARSGKASAFAAFMYCWLDVQFMANFHPVLITLFGTKQLQRECIHLEIQRLVPKTGFIDSAFCKYSLDCFWTDNSVDGNTKTPNHPQ